MRIKFKKGRLGEWTDWFEIRPGALYVDNYNETLDNGELNIDHLDSKLDIQPYDICKIELLDGQYYYALLGDFVCQQISFTPDIFNYTIKTIGLTKILENYLMSSFSITVRDITRSIKYYVQKILNEVQYLQNNFSNNAPFVLDVGSELDQNASEMQMEDPTLREALNNLTMQVDRLVVVKTFNETTNQFVIGTLAINEIGTEIVDKHNINYIEESMQATEYVSDLRINMKNATQSEIVTVSKTYRNEERYLMDNKNLKMPTSLPIWDVKNISLTRGYDKIYFIVTVTDGHGGPPVDVEIESDRPLVGEYGFDLTPYVSEEGVWKTKDIHYGAFASTARLDARYQNSSLYFIRGQRGIHNFQGYEQWMSLFLANPGRWVYEMINNMVGDMAIVYDHLLDIDKQIVSETYDKAIEYARAQIAAGGTAFVNPDIKTDTTVKRIGYSITYIPLYNTVLLANKQPFSRNIRQVIDNQSTNLVNAEKLGQLEFLKANRLGNKVKLVNARYESNEYDLIPQLAQKINGSIIFKRELKIFNDYIIANFYTTDNYVLRDYYTGVRARLRSWKTTIGEDLEKNIHLRFYGNNNLTDYDDGINRIPAHYGSVDELYNILKDKQIVIATDHTEGDVYIIEHTITKTANSVLISFKLFDNATLGKYIDNPNATGGQAQKDYKYVDSYGECSFFEIFLGTYNAPTTEEERAISAQKYPRTQLSRITNIAFKMKYNYQKDNKETPQFTIQFDFNENATNIFYNNN